MAKKAKASSDDGLVAPGETGKLEVEKRLKGEHEALARERTTRRREGRGHLDRVMAVVVNDTEAAAVFRRHIPVGLKAAAHALELGQRLDNRRCGGR